MRQREIETLNDSVEKNHPDHLEELPKKKFQCTLTTLFFQSLCYSSLVLTLNNVNANLSL